MEQDKLEQTRRSLLNHNYELREQIGEGGSGTVFLVWSMKYGEKFVAKKIHVKPTEHIHSEVELLMSLQHPNIINIYEYWCEEETLYIILEYCPNGSLRDYIKSHGPLRGKRLWQALKDIAAAVEYCHTNNVVHRDIKPANLLIDKYDRVKLADFGISALADSRVNAQSGSPAYMSPEALLGKRNVDQFKCDIWALGVTIYELATGSLPWRGGSFAEIRADIQIGLQRRPKEIDYPLFKFLKQMVDVNPVTRATIDEVRKSEFLSRMDLKPGECQRRFGWPDSKGLGDRTMTSFQKLPGLAGSQSAEPRRLSLANTNCVRGALSFVGPSTKKGMREVSRMPSFCSGSHCILAPQKPLKLC